MLRPTILLTLYLGAFTLSFSQQSKAADHNSAQTLQLVKLWSTLQASWGVPSLQPVAGSSLQLIEKSRAMNSQGLTVFHYNFKVTGLPQNASYTMEYWPVGAPSHPFQLIAHGVKINKDGLVVCGPDDACGDKTKSEFPLEVAVPRTALGDTHRFLLSSEKTKKVWVTGIATPFPIRAASEGCMLEIVRMSSKGEILFFFGSGFPANKDITIEGNSAGELHHEVVHTDPDGTFRSSELPFVTGKNFGVLDMKVTAGAACHPSISTEWGEGSIHLQ